MPYSPPGWLDRLAGILLPPSSAEHALGDLSESSRSGANYLGQLASILPRVVWSQVRRRATIGGVLFNAGLSLAAIVVALGFPKAPFFAEPGAWLRLAVPWALWVAGGALAAAYGRPSSPTHWSRPVFVALSLTALASAGVLGLPVGRVAAALGSAFLIVLGLSMPWLRARSLAPLSLDSLADHARLFQRTIWWRNVRESVAAVVVIALNANDLWQSGDPVARAAHGLFVAGALFIMAFLNLRARSRAVPPALAPGALLDFHKHEIARQRDILRAVPLWYLLPLVPGFVVSTAAKWETSPGNPIVALLVAAVLFVVVWRLNVMGARWLDRQLAEVESIGRQP